jgi:hypothetical protein
MSSSQKISYVHKKLKIKTKNLLLRKLAPSPAYFR